MMFRILWAMTLVVKGALGCSCVGETPACAEFGTASAVFLGSVVRIARHASKLQGEFKYMERRVTFEAIESFRGVTNGQVTVITGIGNGDCGFPFRVGKAYLVYALGAKELRTGICSRTAPVENAAEDLAFLRSLTSSGPEGKILGFVSSKIAPRWGKYSGDGAIAGATVRLKAKSVNQTVTTDSKGEYEFPALLPGEYSLSVDMPNKLGGGEVRHLRLPAQACLYEPFYAKELGSISGTVRDAVGSPVLGTWVELVRAEDLTPMGINYQDLTNVTGHYRIIRVPAGRYFLGVHLEDPPRGDKNLWSPYERNYYPGTGDVKNASPIQVDTAAQINDASWQIGLELMGRRVIKGIVLGPDEKPASPVFVELKVEGYERNAELAETRQEGAFQFEGLTGVEYYVQASSGWRKGSEAWHCHRVRVPSGDEPLTIKLDRPGKDCDECRKKR